LFNGIGALYFIFDDGLVILFGFELGAIVSFKITSCDEGLEDDESVVKLDNVEESTGLLFVFIVGISMC